MRGLLSLIDRLTERSVRRVAHSHGRRSLVTRLGVALVGGALLPMLPFDRSGQFGSAHAAGHGSGKGRKLAANQDPTQCEYWRYCAFDGYLCTCCGGSLTGTLPEPGLLCSYILLKEAKKALDGDQRRFQVMRNGVGKTLQFSILELEFIDQTLTF